jgi:PGF-CTERM protein
MRSELADGGITRRQVLQATGAAVALGTLGLRPAAAQEGCQGAELDEVSDDFPEINLRAEQPEPSNVPDADLIVYLHGFDTPPEYGRRLAATFETALPADAPPVVAAPWRAAHEVEATTQEEGGEKFAQAEQNADDDGQKLATWLRENAGDRTVRLVGYSLGTRTALSTVDALDAEAVDLASVSLLGPAVPGSAVCADSGYDLSAARAVFGYRSERDQVLCQAFAGYLALYSDAEPPALGCGGPACDTLAENFVDRNVTETIGDHCAYGFSEVGVVPQVASDFTTPLSDIEQEPDDSMQPSPEATETPKDTRTPGGQEPSDDSDTPAPESSDSPVAGDEETDDSDGPGFGIGAALAGLGSAGYLLKRRRTGE